MGAFKMAGMTVSSIFKKPITYQYPFEQRQPPDCLKGHIENNASECILCGRCQKACPCQCITVDKNSRSWQIDPFMCILCRSCVRSCPANCLTMVPVATPIATEKYVKNEAVPEKE